MKNIVDTIYMSAKVIFSAIFFALPAVSLAGDSGTVEPFLGTDRLFLWAAIAIGLITSFMVVHSAHKIGGGIIQGVYNRLGIGMLIIVIGLTIVALSAHLPEFIVLPLQYGFFMLGFTVMSFGAKRLLTAVGLK